MFRYPIVRLVLAAQLLIGALSVNSANLPPKNEFLADSVYAVGHVDSAQQDSVRIAGPLDKSRALRSDEIDYAAVGPAHFGNAVSSPYADGSRVSWSNGLDRIVKLDHESFEILATLPFPGAYLYSEQEAEDSIANFDDGTEGIFSMYHAYQDAQKLRDLSSVYTLLDRDNIYYIANKNGFVTAYGDAVEGDRTSAIVEKRRVKLPAGVTGLTIGMNMTYDGWLVIATEHGYIVALKRDFSESRVIRIKHGEGAEEKATRPVGYGWVRNGFAIDKEGGIYIASQQHMHKIIWDGNRLSTDEKNGAWTSEYDNSWSHGTGATPSLMGFGNEDQFVVITDGAELMNVTLFWRNEIPADWRQIPGTTSRRIAGLQPANMGNPHLEEIQSEQSVVVAGYGALVVNNVPRNIPWYLPKRASSLLISFMGSAPEHQPYGVQKFSWDPKKRSFNQAWVNTQVSSPNCVPLVSHEANRMYLIGARDNQWTLEAINWDSGESDFHYVIGGQRYNSLFAGTLIDQQGRINYGTSWGRVRLNPVSR